MVNNLANVLQIDESITTSLIDVSSPELEQTILEKGLTARAAMSAFQAANENNVSPSNFLMEVANPNGEVKYYKATIASGSYESGEIVFDVTTVSKSVYDDANLGNGDVKMTYDTGAHKFKIELQNADGTPITFTQGELDADVLDHIKEGIEAWTFGTYDMSGDMIENNNKWRIEFSTDKNHNVESMSLVRQ